VDSGLIAIVAFTGGQPDGALSAASIYSECHVERSRDEGRSETPQVGVERTPTAIECRAARHLGMTP
jgi:hypothetical protein